MAYSYDFKDNVTYGADDINAIRATILTKGVVEDSFDSLKVVTDVSGVKVTEGQAIFADGCRLAVDSDGVVKTLTTGVVNYVYLYNNTLAGVCEVVVSTASPTGDFILLAEVDSSGNILDKRSFAQLKTAESERYVRFFTADFTMNDNMADGEFVTTITLPKSNCSYIEFNMNFDNNEWLLVKYLPADNKVIEYLDNGLFSSNEVHGVYLTISKKTISLKYEIIGNQLLVSVASITKREDISRRVSMTGICVR